MQNIRNLMSCFSWLVALVLLCLGGCGPISLTPPEERPAVEVSSMFQEAQQLFGTGQLQEAIDLWEQIPPTDPHYLDAQFAIRTARLQIHQEQDTHTESFRTTSRFDSYVTQAEQLEQAGNIQEALELYEEARLLEPQNIALFKKIEALHGLLDDTLERHTSLGELYFSRGEYDKALREWQGLLRLDPANDIAKQRIADIEVLTATNDMLFLQRGRTFLRKGLINEARAEFEKARRVDASNQQTWRYLEQLDSVPFSMYSVEKGDTLSSIAEKYTRNPSDFVILADFNRLNIHAPLGIGQELKIPHVLRFKQVLAPDTTAVFPELEESEPNEESRALLPPAEPVFPDIQEPLFPQNIAKENFDDKTAAGEEREAQQHAHVETLIQSGRTYQQAGDLKNAQAAFKDALALDPGNARAIRYLAEARDDIQALITSHLNQGIKFFNQEALEDAILEWDKVLELDPGNRQAVDYKERAGKMLDALASPN